MNMTAASLRVRLRDLYLHHHRHEIFTLEKSFWPFHQDTVLMFRFLEARMAS